MASEKVILATLDRVYEAAVDTARWPDAVRALRDLFGAAGACVFAMDSRTHQVPLWMGMGMEAGERAYREHYASVDPRLKFALTHPETRLHYDYQFIDDRGMDRDEFYDFQRRSSDDFRYFLGCAARVDGAMTGFAAVHWQGRRGHAQPDDIHLLEAISPHLERAMQIGHRLAGLQLRLAAAQTALEHLGQGVVLLDTHNRVLLMNRLAAEILEAKDGLALKEGELHAGQPSVDVAVQALIAGARSRQSRPGAPPGGVIPVPRFSPLRPYSLLITPSPPGSFPSLVEPPAVLVFVSDPEQSHEMPEESLMRLWGLTRAEAALAARLAAGLTIERVADALGMARTTGRLHLQHIFKKTGTHRQAELVRLLLSVPAPLPPFSM